VSTIAVLAQPLLTGLAATLAIAFCGILIMGGCFRALPTISGASRHACYFVLLCTLIIAPVVTIGAVLVHPPVLDVAAVVASDSRAGVSSVAEPIGARARMPISHDAAAAVAPSLAPAVSPGTKGPDLLVVAALIWISVAALRTAMLAIAFVRVLGIKRRGRPLASAGHPRIRGLRILVHEDLTMPVAIGYLRPAIVVPRVLLDEVDEAQLRQLLAHEAAHLRRYDDWTTLIERLALALFWFNPFARVIARRLELEREIACDEDVVSRAGGSHGYATLLWQLAQGIAQSPHLTLAPGAVASRSQTATRLRALLERRPAPNPSAARRMIAGAVLVCAGALTLCAQLAPALAAASAAPSSFTRVTLANGDLLVLGGVPTCGRQR